MDKLISVADTTHAPLRMQAEAFKEEISKLILFYMNQAITSDRATLAGILRKQGHGDIADHIGRI